MCLIYEKKLNTLSAYIIITITIIYHDDKSWNAINSYKVSLWIYYFKVVTHFEVKCECEVLLALYIMYVYHYYFVSVTITDVSIIIIWL